MLTAAYPCATARSRRAVGAAPQYRYGTPLRETFEALYAEGGVCRFYQGLPWALLQTPLTRFGDTASNSGVLLLLASTSFGQALPLGLHTAIASVTAALWRLVLTPIDTLKTTMQAWRACADLLATRPTLPPKSPDAGLRSRAPRAIAC